MKRSRRLDFHPMVAVLEDRLLLAAPITEFAIPAGARTIVSGPGGNLWFTLADDHIGRITPSGQATTSPIPSSHGGPASIAAGSDDNLWFTYAADPGIGRITPGGQYTTFAPGTEPDDIAIGPDGSLWFTESAVNAIGRITPAGVFSEFSIPTADSRPVGITAGPDSNVWFAESHAARIGRFRVSMTDLGIAIVSGPARESHGHGLTYTITVTNHGPIAATDVMLSEEYLRSSIPLPSPTTGITATASQGTVSVAPVLAQPGRWPAAARPP